MRLQIWAEARGWKAFLLGLLRSRGPQRAWPAFCAQATSGADRWTPGCSGGEEAGTPVRSLLNFEKVLRVGWGGHGDFLQVGHLDWLVEGRVGFERWREGMAVLEQEPHRKPHGARSQFTGECRLPWHGSPGGTTGRECQEKAPLVPTRPVVACGTSAVDLTREPFCPRVTVGDTWRHFWLSQLGMKGKGCYRHLVCRDQGSNAQDRPSPSKELSGPKYQ